ncbi:hypothetical protein ID741_002552 [Enterococcus sp. AZ103]
MKLEIKQSHHKNQVGEKMRYKNIKKLDVEISELAVGTWAIGGQMWGEVNDQASVAAIREMIDQGVNLIDTAPIYADGHSEVVVGQALKDGYRENVLVATKFGVSYAPDGSVINNNTYENVLAECQQSLERLGTDMIDIYIIHWPDPNTPIAETMRALNDLKAAGKIRFSGVSNFDQAGIEAAQEFGSIDFVQLPFSMVKEDDKSLLIWCEEQGIGTMTYGSLGSGILTGAIRQKPDWSPDDVRLTFYDYYHEPKFSKIMKLVDYLDELAEKYQKPLAQIALNWSTTQPFVSTAITGVRNTEEAKENTSTFNWNLSEDDLANINEVLADLEISDGKSLSAAERKTK